MSCTKRYSVLILLSLSLLLPSCNSKECSIKTFEEVRDPFLSNRIEAALDKLAAVIIANKQAFYYSTIFYDVNPTLVPNHVQVLGWCSASESADRCSNCIAYLIGRMKKEQCPLKLLMRLIDGDNCIVRYKVGNQTIDRDNAPDLDFRVYQSPVRVPSHYWEYFNSVVGMEIRLLVRLVPSQWDGYLKRARKIHLNRRMALNSLGQCPRNLSESACDRCMKAAMEALLQACPGQDACGVVSSSCILKYSTSEVM